MRVGYIGLGDMGGPMAAHLAPAGFETTVFDLDESKVDALVKSGARAASGPREVGERSDVLCVCVPADAHVRAVVLGDEAAEGALGAMAPGGVIAIHSTIQPDTAEQIHAAASARGCTAIDASVTGGAAAAEAGELVFLVGGDGAAVEKARPVLEASSKTILHAGGIGCGAKLKLAVNTLTYIHWAAVVEAYGLARQSGIDPKLFIEAVRGNGQLSDMEMRFVGSLDLPPEVRESESYQAFMRVQTFNAEKDLDHALALARGCGLAMPTAALVSQQMAHIYGVRDTDEELAK
jgi:3-hydroxyisobutyrate dehydrogenase